MEELVSRNNSSSVDVLIIVAFDSSESLGVDLRSDLENFCSLGLNVGILPLMQSGNAKRFRNSELAQTVFDLKIPIYGSRDMCSALLAIVYSPGLYLSRALPGSFSAEAMAFVLDGLVSANWGSSDLEELLVKCDEVPLERIYFLATTGELLDNLKNADASYALQIWNFHKHSSPLPQGPVFSHEYLWVGAPDPKGNRHSIYALRNFSKMLANENSCRLALRAPVPSALQTGRDEPDLVVGFPFVPADRYAYFSSLDAYVVPRESLQTSEWRRDVFDCLAVGVPTIMLPPELEPYFGRSVVYFETDTTELLDSIELGKPVRARLAEQRRDLLLSRGRESLEASLESLGLQIGDRRVERADSEKFWKGLLLRREVRAPVDAGRPRVVFVTSNGAGMGHLTRLLAVARRLASDIAVSFISMSQACGVVAAYGFDFEYIASKGDLSVEGPEWNAYFNQRFIAALNRIQPDVVVFDGTWPYQGITKAILDFDARFVWMRRGMWREETASTSLVRNTNFDWVIAPGEVGKGEDRGVTSRAVDALVVPPIIVMDRDEILTREQARSELGIEQDHLAALVTLGAGNINAIDQDVERIIHAVNELPSSWRLFMTSPIIAEKSRISDGVETLSIYPIAKYARAFDFVVSATGYNSFHEWIAYGVPTLWIANENTITDDQVGRALFADGAGLGIAAGPGAGNTIEEAVAKLGRSSFRDEVVKRLGDYAFVNGAIEAASHLNDIARGSLE